MIVDNVPSSTATSSSSNIMTSSSSNRGRRMNGGPVKENSLRKVFQTQQRESITSRTADDLTLQSSFYASLHKSLSDFDDSFESSFASFDYNDSTDDENDSDYYGSSNEDDDNEEGEQEVCTTTATGRSERSSFPTNTSTDNEEQQQEVITSSQLEPPSSKQQQQQKKPQRVMEVAPGFTLPVIDAKETWESILDGNITIVSCVCCSQDLYCNLEATHILCPTCSIIIGPTTDTHDDDATHEQQKVAIGVTADFIMKHTATTTTSSSSSNDETTTQSRRSSYHHHHSENDDDLVTVEPPRQEQQHQPHHLLVASPVRSAQKDRFSMSELILQWTSDDPDLLDDYFNDH